MRKIDNQQLILSADSEHLILLRSVVRVRLPTRSLPALGHRVFWVFQQDQTGNRTVVGWPENVQWVNGISPSIALGPNQVTILMGITVDGGKSWIIEAQTVGQENTGGGPSTAVSVSVDSSDFERIEGSNVQEALSSIDSQLGEEGPAFPPATNNQVLLFNEGWAADKLHSSNLRINDAENLTIPDGKLFAYSGTGEFFTWANLEYSRTPVRNTLSIVNPTATYSYNVYNWAVNCSTSETDPVTSRIYLEDSFVGIEASYLLNNTRILLDAPSTTIDILGDTIITGNSILYGLITVRGNLRIANSAAQLGAVLVRDQERSLALQDGTNSQMFSVYQVSEISNSNYRRLRVHWPSTSVLAIQAETAGTFVSNNVTIALCPRNSGALCLQIPDNTILGGNARGAGSVDLQRGRSNAAQVVSGPDSFMAGCITSTVTGQSSAILAGQGNNVSGQFSAILGGDVCQVSGNQSAVIGGRFGFVNSNESVILGGFLSGTRGIDRLVAFSGAGKGVGYGDCHGNALVIRGTGSGTTPRVLTSNDSATPSAANQYMLQNNSSAALFIASQALLTNGTRASWFHAVYIWRGANAASTTVDLLQSLATHNTIGATLTIDANTTLGCLRVTYTGGAIGETAYVQSVILGGFQFF